MYLFPFVLLTSILLLSPNTNDISPDINQEDIVSIEDYANYSISDDLNSDIPLLPFSVNDTNDISDIYDILNEYIAMQYGFKYIDYENEVLKNDGYAPQSIGFMYGASVLKPNAEFFQVLMMTDYFDIPTGDYLLWGGNPMSRFKINYEYNWGLETLLGVGDSYLLHIDSNNKPKYIIIEIPLDDFRDIFNYNPSIRIPKPIEKSVKPDNIRLLECITFICFLLLIFPMIRAITKKERKL